MTTTAHRSGQAPTARDDSGRATLRRRASRGRARWAALAFVVPALAVYTGFVLVPIVHTVQYSFYEWDGVSQATWVGTRNYQTVFEDPTLLASVEHAFELIIFFSLIPVTVGLLVAATVRRIARSRFAGVARTIVFIPQVIPLVAAGIIWSWLYASDGLVNQVLGLVGLGGVTRAWLGEFSTALPAVGMIGAWVEVGLCMLLCLAGMSKIDDSLYEAARLDGAGPVREFWSITLPSLRAELVVCVTVTIIAALSSFDIVYISTQGGPGNATSVPGLSIFYLAFTENRVGVASALAVVLMVLVLAVVLVTQRLGKGEES